ncbi:MAG: YggS family pyridoxal phosphate-dependent enzyme [Treponema sp.]|nr:YggS family pyridoxal phosphate-dependent enzyme [Candidatus Treponema caballi]
MSIKENCELILDKIHAAEARAGRPEGSVKLMAVSKFHPADAVVEALGAGITLFGENRVQEACGKFPDIFASHPEAELHLIGSLQRNKVKQILPLVSCIQSVDRLELIEEIAKQKDKLCPEKKLSLLFEVHTGEESKSGFTDADELIRAVDYTATLSEKGIVCAGFMTMAPLTDDEKAIRASFRSLVKTADMIKARFPELPLTELSMGMSHDFEIAVEEGSTLVRVGTAIFGERVYA